MVKDWENVKPISILGEENPEKGCIKAYHIRTCSLLPGYTKNTHTHTHTQIQQLKAKQSHTNNKYSDEKIK